jgi:hypothetical protein
MATIWAFLIYWMVVFVGCYIVVEVGQDQLYDEVTPHVGLKVTGGSLILALLLTWLRPSYLTMFTTNFAWTVLQAIVWFGVFTLIFQFHPWHGLGLGLAAMLLVSGLATMGVESILTPTPASANRPAASQVSKPVRESLGPAPVQTKPAETKK